MRLHRLAITAFGPFAGTAEVDFEKLSTDGLFLLHGATGSGKTTVLDAIAFALYGRVPGVRGKENRLRCDYAISETAPRVELEASIGGRRLRIIRSPEFNRPKRRGKGETKVNASVSLTWLDGKGNNLTRHTEVGDEVNRLLGMSADQFFQVVMLPQGEFAKFLVAANDEREKLLERLFDTGRFKTAEDWLADQRRQSADELATLSQGRDRLVSEIKGATSAELPTDDHTKWATDLLQCARARFADGEAEYTKRREELNAARERVAEEESLKARLDRRARAVADSAALDAQQAQISAVRSELLFADRAAEVTSLGMQLEEAHAHRTAADRQVLSRAIPIKSDADGEEVLTTLDGQPSEVQARIVESAVAAWHSEIGQLDAVIPLAERLLELESDRTGLIAGLEETAGRIAQLASERDALPARLTQTEADLATASVAGAQVGSLNAMHAEVTEQLDAAKRLVKQEHAVAIASEKAAASRLAHLAARENLVDVRERRLNSMAAELADALVDGEPCQVCGSAEHPAPAVAGSQAATKNDEKLAREAEHCAAEAKERAQDLLVGAEREADRLRLLAGGESVDLIEAKLADAARRLAEAKRASIQVAELARQIDRLKTQSATIEANLAAAEKDSAVLQERVGAADDEICRLQRAIGASAGSDSSPVERRDRLARLAEDASALRDAILAASAAAEVVADIQAKLEAAAENAGFANVHDARQASRSVVSVRQLEATVRAFEDRQLRVSAVLEETADDAEKFADVASASAILDEATVRAERAAAERQAAQHEVAKLERLVVDLWAADSKIAPKRERHEELAGIADLVAGRGQNQRKMSLRSYVLAARLEEVAAEASIRLRRMSGGRYEFVHSDAAGPRGTLGGLGLDVRDLYNDQVRSVKTLSGGEKFMASLACALGLADVVANEAGGTMLDTLFIDEGFGSLDGESLESVMSVIDDLREGGRIIGVVSHVEEMRQRIPSRLHVVRGHAGSRLEVQVS